MADNKKAAAPKKETKKKKASKLWPYKTPKFCPKCGPGVRLAEHKERKSCGKCGYFEKN